MPAKSAKMKKPKLFRITTVPLALSILLKGQLGYMNSYFEVVAISSPGNHLEIVQLQEKVRVRSIKMTRKITPIQDFCALLEMLKFFRKERPLIIHTHTPKAGLIGLLAGYLVNVPHRLHTVAGVKIEEAKGIKRALFIFTEKLSYKLATRVYPNSYELQKYIIKNKFTTLDKLKVIGNGSSNGIDLEYYERTSILQNEAQKIIAKYHFSHRDFIFCFVGRVVKDKGIDELIAAFQQMHHKYDNVKLLLVGPFEDDLNPISQNAKKHMEQNPNIFCSYFQHDVRPFLMLSSVFTFPSYREGFPNALLQACCMELPIITTNINGCNEIVQHNHNGLIIEKKSTKQLFHAMELLYRDQNLYQNLKKNAREIALKYDQKDFWQALYKEYNNVIYG